MIEKYTIDQLTNNSVSVKKEIFMVEDGQEIPVGNPHRKTYENNAAGRQLVIDELPEPQKNAIFAIWGDDDEN